jgi:hypothetical protein
MICPLGLVGFYQTPIRHVPAIHLTSYQQATFAAQEVTRVTEFLTAEK